MERGVGRRGRGEAERVWYVLCVCVCVVWCEEVGREGGKDTVCL